MILSHLNAILLGALTWSFLEYCIHRWLGHDRRFRPNLFAKEHTRHHIEGHYFAPWWKKASAATVVAALSAGPAFLAGAWLAGSWTVGGGYVVGFVGFYLTYEVLHRREHVSEGVGPYGRWARRHHFAHHFVDARFNHGVTSPLWDLVFGTYRPVDHIAVPRRLAMRWLVDPLTGEVREHLRERWSLKGRPRVAAPAPRELKAVAA